MRWMRDSSFLLSRLPWKLAPQKKFFSFNTDAYLRAPHSFLTNQYSCWSFYVLFYLAYRWMSDDVQLCTPDDKNSLF